MELTAFQSNNPRMIYKCLQIANGVDGLIIGGTTGEGQLMSWDEHIMLIAHTVNR